MTIIPSNKVIGMTNYPKDEESSFKNEKIMSILFFEEVFEFTKIRQVYKAKLRKQELFVCMSRPITQKMRSLAFKMKKLWAFHFLRKSLNLQESVKFMKEKLGETIFKTLSFGAQCTNLTQIFFKSCVITK